MDQQNQNKNLIHKVTSYIYPVATTVFMGYLVAPYTSTLTRNSFPYFYSLATGKWSEDLGYAEYAGIYLPMREHCTDFAYQNSYAISMGIIFMSYMTVKYSYKLGCFSVEKGSKAINYLYSFFQNNHSNDNNEEDEYPETMLY